MSVTIIPAVYKRRPSKVQALQYFKDDHNSIVSFYRWCVMAGVVAHHDGITGEFTIRYTDPRPGKSLGYKTFGKTVRELRNRTLQVTDGQVVVRDAAGRWYAYDETLFDVMYTMDISKA